MTTNLAGATLTENFVVSGADANAPYINTILNRTGTLVLDAPAGVIVTEAANAVQQHNGPIAVDVVGAGEIVFDGADAYSGGTTISNSGEVSILNAGALGSGVVTVMNESVLEFAASMTFADAINTDYADFGAATDDSVTLKGAFTAANAITFGSAIDQGVISLSPVASASATTPYISLTVAGGTLKLGDAAGMNLLAAAMNVEVGVDSATLDIDGFAATLQGLSGSGVVTDNGSATTLTLVTEGSEFDGAVEDGAGKISVAVAAGSSSSNWLVLGGTLGWSGSTTVETGATLQIGEGGDAGAVNAFATSPLVVDGVFAVDRSDAVTVGGALSGSGVVRQTGSGSLALKGAGAGFSGTAEIDSGTLILDNANSLGAGNVTFAGGGVLEAGKSAAVGGQLVIDPGVDATLEASPGQTLFVSADYISVGGGAGTTLHIGSASETGTVSISCAAEGPYDSNSALAIDGGTLVIAGYNANSEFADLEGGTSVGTTTATATLDIDGRTFSVFNLTGNGSGVITDNGAAATVVMTLTDAAPSTFAGVIEDGSGQTSVDIWSRIFSDCVLVLTGANTYTGSTTIEGDTTLQIGDGGTTGSLSALSAIAIAGDDGYGPGALQFDRSDAVTFAASFSGAGVLRQMGSGTLTLAGSGAGFTGTAEIDSGALVLANANALGSGGVTFAGSGALQATVNATITGPVTIESSASATFETAAQTLLAVDASSFAAGLGATLHFGSATDTGAVVLDSANPSIAAYADVAIDGGSVLCGPATNTEGDLLSMAARSAIGTTSATALLALNGNVTLNDLSGNASGIIGNRGGPATLTVVNNSATQFAGVIHDGAGAITLAVSGVTGGVLTLAGASTYSGGTTLESGTLDIANAKALGSGALAFGAGAKATLEIEAGDTPANVISGFAAGDAIEFAGLAFGPGDHIAVVGSGAMETVEIVAQGGAVLESLTFSGAYAPSGLALVSVAGGLEIIDAPVVTVAQFSAQQATLNALPAGFAVSDTAADITAGLAALAADQAHINSVTATGGAISATIVQFQSDQPILDKVVGGFAVSDTAATISAYLTASVATGQAPLAADASPVTSITATGGAVTIGNGVFVADQAALDKIVGGFAISGKASVLNGNLAGLEADQANIDSVTATGGAITATIAQFGADEPILNKVAGGFVVSDTAATIAATLTGTVPTALALDAGHITSITASGGAVTVGDGAFVADRAALDKIAGGFWISGKASVLNGNLAGLEADQANIDSVTATGGAITATIAQFVADEPLLNKAAGGFAVSDTAANIATWLTASVATGPSALALDASHVTAITASGGPVTVGNGVFVADRAALDAIVGGFAITGKASVLDGNLDGLQNDVGHIVSITGTGGPITGTMANFARDEAAMNTIVGGFDISDTAANIAAGLGLLQGDVGAIDAITLTDATKPTITLTAAQHTADLAVLGKITSPYTLIVT